MKSAGLKLSWEALQFSAGPSPSGKNSFLFGDLADQCDYGADQNQESTEAPTDLDPAEEQFDARKVEGNNKCQQEGRAPQARDQKSGQHDGDPSSSHSHTS